MSCNCKGNKELKMKVADEFILWARDNDTVKIPTKREEDAGWDIYPNFEEDYILIRPHETIMISTGLHSAFSSKWVAILKERGSNGSKGIAQRCGVIDSGFRNEWKIPLTNTNDVGIIIRKDNCDYTWSNSKGDAIIYPYDKAICQAIFVEVPKLESREISLEDLLNIPSERGLGMLGSSGK